MPKRGIIFINSSTLNEHNTLLNVNYKDLDKLQAINKESFFGNVWFKGKFRRPLDVVNHFLHGTFYDDADYPTRRKLLDIKNPLSFNSLFFANLFEEYGIEYEIINNLDSELDKFIQFYESMNPKPVVGISATFVINWAVLKRGISKLLEIDPAMTIVSGGALYPTMLHDSSPQGWETHMKRLRLRAVFFAQCSERDLVDYLASEQDDASMHHLSNVAWFDSRGEFHVNPSRDRQPLLDGVPLNFSRVRLDFSSRIIAARTAFGCPFSCAYCNYPAIAKKWKQMDTSRFDAMMAELSRIKEVTQVQIIDDTFNVPESRTREICGVMAKHRFQWYSFIRPQYVDRETARMLADSGYVAGMAGIESGSDAMLANMNKKATTTQIAAGIENLIREGIRVIGFFLIGFPGETVTTAMETERFIENCGIDFYQINQYTFLSTPGMSDMISRYHLSGSFTDWRHDTMNYLETGRIKNAIYKSVKNAVHLNDGTTQHLQLMLSSGFTLDETKEVFSRINSVVKDQMDGVFQNDPPSLSEVARLASRK